MGGIKIDLPPTCNVIRIRGMYLEERFYDERFCTQRIKVVGVSLLRARCSFLDVRSQASTRTAAHPDHVNITGSGSISKRFPAMEGRHE
jgi:hypothetical protein